MINKIDVGQKIRDLRKSKNVSQQELGNALGKSHAAISDIETGKTDLSVKDLTQIAAFFDVSVDTFIGSPAVQPSSTPFFNQLRTSKDITQSDEREINKASNDFISEMRKRIKDGSL